MSRKSPDPYDIATGKRIRNLRLLRGMSQEKVADALDLTFQQVQKYEKGVNRIAPSRLNVLAKLFKVPMTAFFHDEIEPKGNLPPLASLLSTRQRVDLFKLLEKLDNPHIDTLMLRIAETLAEK